MLDDSEEPLAAAAAVPPLAFMPQPCQAQQVHAPVPATTSGAMLALSSVRRMFAQQTAAAESTDAGASASESDGSDGDGAGAGERAWQSPRRLVRAASLSCSPGASPLKPSLRSSRVGPDGGEGMASCAACATAAEQVPQQAAAADSPFVRPRGVMARQSQPAAAAADLSIGPGLCAPRAAGVTAGQRRAAASTRSIPNPNASTLSGLIMVAPVTAALDAKARHAGMPVQLLADARAGKHR